MTTDSPNPSKSRWGKGFKRLATKNYKKNYKEQQTASKDVGMEGAALSVPRTGDEQLLTQTKDTTDDDDFVESGRVQQKSNKSIDIKKRTSAIVPKTVSASKKQKTKESKYIKQKTEGGVESTQIKISPKILTDMIASLSDEQKEWVRRAGFGHLLNFALTGLPHRLGYKILQAFDHASCSLRIKSGELFITEEDVANVLGLPIGPRKITKNLSNELRSKWRGQFHVTEGRKITAMSVYYMIKNSTTVDQMFKLNFLVLISNTLIHSLGNPYVDQQILNFDGDLDNTAQYNWCAMVIDSLVNSKTIWAEDPKKKYYQGPLTFLILFYVEHVLYKGKRTDEKRIPSFLGWTSNDLRQRQTEELESNSFGRGALVMRHPPIVPEIAETKSKKQVDIDSDSDAENIEIVSI